MPQSPGDGDEHELLVGPPDRHIADLPNAAHVVFMSEHLALDRGPFLGQERVCEGAVRHLHGLREADDREVILRVVMNEGVADGWCRLHDEAGQGSVETGAPAFGGNDLPALDLLRILTEVPDVALTILRVIIEVPLCGLTCEEQ